MKRKRTKSSPSFDQFIEAFELVHPSTKTLLWRNFLRGIFFGLGTTVGVAMVVGIITYVLTQLKAIPFFEEIIYQTRIEEVLPKTIEK